MLTTLILRFRHICRQQSDKAIAFSRAFFVGFPKIRENTCFSVGQLWKSRILRSLPNSRFLCIFSHFWRVGGLISRVFEGSADSFLAFLKGSADSFSLCFYVSAGGRRINFRVFLRVFLVGFPKIRENTSFLWYRTIVKIAHFTESS